MWQSIKNLIYDFIVWTRILYYISPALFSLIQWLPLKIEHFSNYEVVDEGGEKFRLVRYNGKLYSAVGVDKIKSIPDVTIRKDDVLLCSYPKAGCHWLQEIMHMLKTGKLELTKLGKEFAGGIDLIHNIFLDSVPSPRVLNSHLWYSALPNGVRKNRVKIVWLVRNPKDTVVSFYNHLMDLKKYYGYGGKFGNYFKLFMNGQLENGSYFDYMLEWDNILKNPRDNPIFLISYEDLKVNTLDKVKELARFLEVPVTDQFAREIIDACSFTKLKNKRSKQNDIGGKMYRKGIVGDWRNCLTAEQSETIDRVWRERMMDCTYQPQY